MEKVSDISKKKENQKKQQLQRQVYKYLFALFPNPKNEKTKKKSSQNTRTKVVNDDIIGYPKVVKAMVMKLHNHKWNTGWFDVCPMSKLMERQFIFGVIKKLFCTVIGQMYYVDKEGETYLVIALIMFRRIETTTTMNKYCITNGSTTWMQSDFFLERFNLIKSKVAYPVIINPTYRTRESKYYKRTIEELLSMLENRSSHRDINLWFAEKLRSNPHMVTREVPVNIRPLLLDEKLIEKITSKKRYDVRGTYE